MLDEWAHQLQRLLREFDELASKSNGLFHLMIERKMVTHRDSVYDLEPEWLGLNGRLHHPQWSVISQHLILRAPADSHANPHAHPNAVIRTGYICGDLTIRDKFEELGANAGRLIAVMPDHVSGQLPTNVGILTRPNAEISNNIVGAELSTWILMLHRWGWSAPPGDLFDATRWYWKGGRSVPFFETDLPIIQDDIPTWRFYSVLGIDSSRPVDLCRASAKALDKLVRFTLSLSPLNDPARPILSPKAAAIYDLLKTLPPTRGMTGSSIIEALKKIGLLVDQGSLTSRFIPELKAYGIENKRRYGYRINPDMLKK